MHDLDVFDNPEQEQLLDMMENGDLPYVDALIQQAKSLGLSNRATEEVIDEWLESGNRSFPWESFNRLWNVVSAA